MKDQPEQVATVESPAGKGTLPRRKRRWARRPLWGLLTAFLLALGGFVLFTGPRDLALYPPAEMSPYRLPWKTGITCLCVQGNRAVVSHRGFEEFAYDFKMPVGSDVCAARAGVVTRVVTDHDGNGVDAPNNLIAIRHDDGTVGYYLHLKKEGSYVRVGDKVQQGQRIAASGNVGRSMLPHLHFHVADGRGEIIRVTFSDVKEDRGIPRMFKYYTPGGT
jgi:murein DD-endopeptidase MepM/ murein hydrolase activator NlpD